MNSIKIISGLLCAGMISGCASMDGASGPRGPRIVGSGHATEYGQYAEVGVEFTSVGDFVALVSPSRWKSPVATGGSLSWINPVAWSDDAGRTGRILIGEAVIVGGVAIAAGAGGGGGDETTTSSDNVREQGNELDRVVPGYTP
jgi:hypothetical protein